VLLKNSEHFQRLRKNGDSKCERIIWGHLSSRIYENPVRTEVDLIPRMSSK
jgi:hypothetical protein